MENLSERCSWAIKTIKVDKDLDRGILDIDLAKVLGTDKNTLAAYRNHKGLLKGEFIQRLIDYYHFSPAWLFQGDGEPFPGARAKYSEVCGPEAYTQKPGEGMVNEAAARYTEPGQVKVAEDMALAAKVLESATPYAVALHLNVQAFSRAIDAEERLTQLETKVKILEKKVNNMVKDGWIAPGHTADSELNPGAGETQSSGKRKAM